MSVPYGPEMTERRGTRRSSDANRALLHDERLAVPAPTGTTRLDEMQRLMARWSNGADHESRRRIAVDALAELDPVGLRSEARALTIQTLPSATDLVDLARTVPVTVLAEALGFRRPAEAARHQRVVTAAISPEDGPFVTDLRAAARSLDWLLRSAGEPTLERGANRVALLHQCLDATAALVTAAALPLVSGDRRESAFDAADPAHAAVAQALRQTPPVTRTVRVRESGELVTVDLTAEPHEPLLAFGAGTHECPGSTVAVALAEGVIDGLRSSGAFDRMEVPDPLVFEQRPNLRIPRRLPLS